MKKYAKLGTILLALALLVTILPANPFMAEVEADSLKSIQEVNRQVDHTTYGWVVEKAVINADGTVTVKIMEVPNFETKTYTTAISLADASHTNPITKVSRADALASLLARNAFAEILFDEQNRVIDMEIVEFSEVTYMDSASYGGELTAKNGRAGNMVSTGWILGKNEKKSTITIGDGNHQTNVFEETYTLADDVKIYRVDNSYADGSTNVSKGLGGQYKVNKSWDLVSTGSFDDIRVTGKIDGEIYYVPERWTAVCVFDSDYKTSWEDGKAKVKELYLFDNAVVLGSGDLYTPDGMQYDGTSWYPLKNKNEEKTSFTYGGSIEPVEFMKDRLYDVGDAYTDIYMFVGDDGTLSLLDQGNRCAAYQYWLNIEKMGYDPRNVDNILLTHGHGDHYQALYEGALMIRRAGGKLDVYINPYSQGTTVANDEASYELGATLTDKPVLYASNVRVEWDKWLSFMGKGVSVYPWRSIGHSNDTASYVFKVTATQNDVYFEKGDVVSWLYFGGYGARTSTSQGANRLQITNSMMYQQFIINPWAKAQSDYVYPLAQHTNQYPQHEINKAARIAGISMAEALTEGAEGVSNFLEKRISVGLYERFEVSYRAKTDWLGNLLQSVAGFRCDSSAGASFDTIEAHGPFKRPEGEYTIAVQSVQVLHGFDAFQNPNDAFAGQKNIYGFDLSDGIVIDKDSYTHDPDGWYVQVACRVNDAYDGGVDYETNWFKGNYTSGASNALITKAWLSGPVEISNRPESWFEILRTERFDSRAEAEAFAKALTQNAYKTPYQTYSVNGGALYQYKDTANHAITDSGNGVAPGAATYKVNLSRASEIKLGANFADTFQKIG